MTQPRRVLPGMTVLVTRRSLRRTHLFRPDSELTQLFVYMLCVIAQRHGILVHAAVLMSTHEHLVLTDTRGTLPLFLRELHRLFALGVKALRNWEGAVWDHERPSVVELRTPEAVLEKLGYVIANPVAAGLVESANEWPGVITLPQQLGRSHLSASRPAHYVDARNPLWPSEASLELSMPCVSGMDDDTIREIVEREVAEHEARARNNARHSNKPFVGAKRIKRASPFDRAKSWEPVRARNPAFAVGNGQKSAFFDAVAALRAFRRAYRDALDRWRRGMRETSFPAGTWLMRVAHASVVDPI